MNRRQFILVVLALIIVGAAGLVLFKQQKQSWSVRENKVGDKVFPNFPVNNVAAIHIRGDSELNIVRTNGIWRVQERADYPANYNLVRDFLIKMKDLKVVQSEMVGPSQLGRVDLQPPGSGPGSGTLLEFRDDQGRVIDSLLAGKMHERHNDGSRPAGLGAFFDGRYILLPTDPGNVLLITDELSGVSPRPEIWLNRDFIRPENPQSVSLTSANGDNEWTLVRESSSQPWALDAAQAGESLDPHVATQITEGLKYLNFQDVTKDGDAEKTGLRKPTTLVVRSFDKFVYTLKIGNKQIDGNYLVTVAVTADIPADQSDAAKAARDKLAREQALAPWIYLIDGNRIEAMVRERTQLLAK